MQNRVWGSGRGRDCCGNHSSKANAVGTLGMTGARMRGVRPERAAVHDTKKTPAEAGVK
jgi:hypothetical protein